MEQNIDKNTTDALLSLNINEIPDDLQKESYIARCIKCYDGDSPSFVIYKNNKPEIIRTRLYGIDTPEIKGVTRFEAIKSRNKLISLLTDVNTIEDYDYSKKELDDIFLNNKKLCIVETTGMREKYGRILCNVYQLLDNTRDKHSVVEILIQNNYGVPYFGGSKNVL